MGLHGDTFRTWFVWIRKMLLWSDSSSLLFLVFVHVAGWSWRMKLDHFRVNYEGCTRSTTSSSGQEWSFPSAQPSWEPSGDLCPAGLPSPGDLASDSDLAQGQLKGWQTWPLEERLDKRRLKKITPMPINTQCDGLKKMEPTGFQWRDKEQWNTENSL